MTDRVVRALSFKRWVKGIIDAIKWIVSGIFKGMVVAAIIIPIYSCANAIPVAVGIACYTCGIIQATGICSSAMQGPRMASEAGRPDCVPMPAPFAAVTPRCNPPKQLYIRNYRAVMERGEFPDFVCKGK